MSARHGLPLRGLMSSGRSASFNGRFGRMFRSLPPAHFGRGDADSIANLRTLGAAMSPTLDDPPKDGPDDEESGIPALYTYLGQFIDHDITFDPASSLQKQNDPDALVDFRTPAFDLDSVYGRGPDDQPYLYDGNDGFLLGAAITGGDPGAQDLPRNGATPARALIGDPRNDENSIVSQLHGLFLRFHNRTLKDNPGRPFAEIQELVRFHYQYVVLNDFLPRIVHPAVLNSLKSGKNYDRSRLEFFHWKHEPFMPVEFSAAAYRLGHSMIRPGYRLNDNVLRPIFPVTGFPEGLTGFQAMIPDGGIDWGRMIDLETRAPGVALGDDGKTPEGEAPTQAQLEENARRLQFAYRIDTSLVTPLNNLPAAVASTPSSLAVRNLERGLRLGLPSGQAVARAMGVTVLRDEEILIGKAVDKPDQPLGSIASIPALRPFAHNCPLWTYILAEAMHFKVSTPIPVTGGGSVNTPQLGPVGGRIVAEVFLGLLFGDPNSLLNLDPHWHPAKVEYALRDFVKYALGR